MREGKEGKKRLGFLEKSHEAATWHGRPWNNPTCKKCFKGNVLYVSKWMPLFLCEWKLCKGFHCLGVHKGLKEMEDFALVLNPKVMPPQVDAPAHGQFLISSSFPKQSEK